MENYIYGIIGGFTFITIIFIIYCCLSKYLSNHYNDRTYVINPLQNNSRNMNTHVNNNSIQITIETNKNDNETIV
jgi:hypothetical protein